MMGHQERSTQKAAPGSNDGPFGERRVNLYNVVLSNQKGRGP